MVSAPLPSDCICHGHGDAPAHLAIGLIPREPGERVALNGTALCSRSWWGTCVRLTLLGAPGSVGARSSQMYFSTKPASSGLIKGILFRKLPPSCSLGSSESLWGLVGQSLCAADSLPVLAALSTRCPHSRKPLPRAARRPSTPPSDLCLTSEERKQRPGVGPDILGSSLRDAFLVTTPPCLFPTEEGLALGRSHAPSTLWQ